MKAVVVKNNQFETIGFEVTANSKTLFSWGVAPVMQLHFVKEVSTDDWMTEIFELVKLEAKLSEEKNFARKFFDLAFSENMIKDGKSICFSESKTRIVKLEKSIENIIKNII